ncbi:MerR family transcriptional regulator [Auritidibacter sp. NML130574]|uniref:MerR family transcriptional regulator n=1 Tax=Auritidibacter sp. NML130574 TaxID=2170745 RepID=UPI000D7267FF|nr:MerR family transcriptional regulator [Auritidibacter sp. NML130574]AXR74601.1 MerR family transcriptional regulator [Auritidibacter sp. NML130574]
MKLSALAKATGTSIASIKYYLRVGLISPGAKRNQTTAVYDDTHVERLELIGALRQLVGLSIEQIGILTAVIDDPDASILEVMQTAQILGGGMPLPATEPATKSATGPDPHPTVAEERISALIAAQGWPDTQSAARTAAISVVAEMQGLGLEVSEEYLKTVGAAVDMISESELNVSGSRDRVAMHVAVGTFQYSRLVLALLQLGQASHSIARAGRASPR